MRPIPEDYLVQLTFRLEIAFTLNEGFKDIPDFISFRI